MRRTRGFTRIGLLTVFAICGVLASSLWKLVALYPSATNQEMALRRAATDHDAVMITPAVQAVTVDIPKDPVGPAESRFKVPANTLLTTHNVTTVWRIENGVETLARDELHPQSKLLLTPGTYTFDVIKRRGNGKGTRHRIVINVE